MDQCEWRAGLCTWDGLQSSRVINEPFRVIRVITATVTDFYENKICMYLHHLYS